MTPSLDFLALALLVLAALIAIVFRFLFHDADRGEAFVGEDVFDHQRRYDPAGMELPVTGLGEGVFFVEGNGYLPPDINRLLTGPAERALQDDAAGLESALKPGPAPYANENALHLAWAITAFVILLGLIFLLLWMLTFV